MKKELQQKIKDLGAAFNKIDGLYSLLAKKYNINGMAMNILCDFYTYERLTQKQISERYMLPKQSVNNVIQSLKQDGYITLTSGLEDKREKYIELTEKGRQYSAELLKPFTSIEESIYEKMGEDRVNVLFEAILMYNNLLEEEINK